MSVAVAERTFSPREFLSFREAVVLSETPEDRVRRDIDSGVFTPRKIVSADQRLCFRWFDVFTLAAVYNNGLLTGKLRRRVLENIDALAYANPSAFGYFFEPHFRGYLESTKLKIDRYVFIDIGAVCAEVKPKVDLYADGLKKIEEKEGVLGGEAVFKNSRISVCHVGKLLERGERLENIKADYESLADNDINFARLYYQAHPPIGRPRGGGAETKDAPRVPTGSR